MDRFIVGTFEIDRVRAINRDFACIDIATNGADESEVFVLIITAERRGKQNQREAATAAESEHLELAAQIGRVPFNVTFVHRKIDNNECRRLRSIGVALAWGRDAAALDKIDIL